MSLKDLFPNVLENIPMSEYSTFKAGGPAKFFAEPESVNELQALIGACEESGTEFYVIGNGSNILFSDKGFDGLVIRIGAKGEFAELSASGTSVTAGAGCLLSKFGNECTSNSLTGAEFACGIPGSVGGAVYMNAGAYGGEIKDICAEVTYLDLNGEVNVLEGAKCEFGYRKSVFERENYIVLKAKFELREGNKEEISAYVKELQGKRSASQPLTVPSAGSTFKRPEGYFAGALIQDAGLKGFKLDESGAQVSPKHAGFVVNNEGKASATDIYRLIKHVISEVYKNSGVTLEPEVRLIGDFD